MPRLPANACGGLGATTKYSTSPPSISRPSSLPPQADIDIATGGTSNRPRLLLAQVLSVCDIVSSCNVNFTQFGMISGSVESDIGSTYDIKSGWTHML